MTREEAKNIAYTWDTKATVNYEIKSIIFTSQAVSIIDKIYDDFKSRTCENCKYNITMDIINNPEDRVIVNNVPYCELMMDMFDFGFVDKDFGCNKFERKTDED